MSQISSQFFSTEDREPLFRRVMHFITGSIVIVVASAASMFLVQWFSR